MPAARGKGATSAGAYDGPSGEGSSKQGLPRRAPSRSAPAAGKGNSAARLSSKALMEAAGRAASLPGVGGGKAAAGGADLAGRPAVAGEGGEVQSTAGTPGGLVDMATGQQTAGVDIGEPGVGQSAQEEPGNRASQAEIQLAQVPCATCRCIASCDGNGTRCNEQRADCACIFVVYRQTGHRRKAAVPRRQPRTPRMRILRK